MNLDTVGVIPKFAYNTCPLVHADEPATEPKKKKCKLPAAVCLRRFVIIKMVIVSLTYG